MTTETLNNSNATRRSKAADLRHRAVIQKNIATYDAAVARGKARFADWQNARSRAAAVKWETINHLDRYLEQFERNVLANGGHVFWAETAAGRARPCSATGPSPRRSEGRQIQIDDDRGNSSQRSAGSRRGSRRSRPISANTSARSAASRPITSSRRSCI